jgi:hypothetical protein
LLDKQVLAHESRLATAWMGPRGALMPTGELEKVIIEAREGREPKARCKAMFNPKELSLTRQASWKTRSANMDDPDLEHLNESQSSTLSVTLFFDTYEQKIDCYKLIEPLEYMVRIDPELERPPLCLFQWGAFVFQGVIESLAQKYTMFLSSGMRVRCEVTLTMKSALMAWPDPDNKHPTKDDIERRYERAPRDDKHYWPHSPHRRRGP